MIRRLALAALIALTAAPALAYDGPIDKRPFSVSAFTFQDGHTLPVKIGYETYGALNPAGDNAILLCHYFAGTSHAAGRYAPTDPAPGYWDALIGPGKAFDTSRYFVVSADLLANVNPGDPHVITTGPSTLDPKTGKPYGMRFPAVTIRDQVELQRKLADALGIQKWQMVAGTSLGGMQAMQWAVSYPERVARVLCVTAPGRSDAFNQAMAQVMMDAIEADGNFRGGDYYGHEAPNAGLAAAWKLLYTQCVDRLELVKRIPGATGSAEPAFAAELAQRAAKRVPLFDANAWWVTARESRDFDLSRGYPDYASALKRIQARVMVIAAMHDTLFPPERLDQDLIQQLRAAGRDATFRVLNTRQGHLGGVFDLANETASIQAFLR